MTLALYPASAHDAFHGTTIQYSRDIDEAVKQIHDACKGMGTDEHTLIAVLGSKSPETRNLISLRYKELYQQPLKSLLKSETSGDFGRLLRMIATPLAETEAQILHDATKGMGTTESLLMQILAGRTNEEMNILKRTYFGLIGADLAVTLSAELSGDFRKVVMAVLQSSQVPYNPAVHNARRAEEEAVALYKAGQGRLGTDEEAFIDILVKASPEFLKMVDAVYVAKYNNNIAKAVDKEFSGDAKKSLNYLIRSSLDPYATIAELFEKTMKGFGTDETGLSTTLVRYQSVLPHVKAAYRRTYREDLRDRISAETSGDYKKLLLEVFDAPHDRPIVETTSVSGVAHDSPKFNAMGAREVVPNAGAEQLEHLSSGRSNPPTSSARQQPSAPPVYSVPTVQQPYGQPSQAAPGQTLNVSTMQRTPSTQPNGFPAQAPGSHQVVYSSENSFSGQNAAHTQTPEYSASRYLSSQQPYAPSEQQSPIQQYQQHPSPTQQQFNQPYQQYLPGQQQHQQQPLNQHYQQYPAPGCQSQPFQQYGVPSGPELQPLNHSYGQNPVPGLQSPSQPYQQYSIPGQQYPIPGQQHTFSQTYQQYPTPQQQPHYPPSQYQQYGVPPGQPQQGMSQHYGQYAPQIQQPSPQSYQQYTGYEQQQYPVPQPQYTSGQPQPYQQYGGQFGQSGYPSNYGATLSPEQRGGYSPPHQHLHGNPSH